MPLNKSKEITALLYLLDDLDETVYNTVEERILHYGTSVIARLEKYWERTEDPIVQQRIESLIHRALFQSLVNEFLTWGETDEHDLLEANILLGRYRYPHLVKGAVYNQFNQMKRNIWLELNPYMTALEKIHVINGIFYSYYKLKGKNLSDNNTEPFFINNVVASMQGNCYSIGCLYLAICEQHDIPVYAIDLPGVFLLAYIENVYSFRESEDPVQKIQFYIDPRNGTVFTQSEVNNYLKMHELWEFSKGEVDVLNNKRVMIRMIEALADTYQANNNAEAKEELQSLASALSNLK